MIHDSSGFMPHGHCYLWRPEILWLHVISDALIVIAYYSIPITLIYLVFRTKEKIPYNWVILLFALFIMACGTTHLLEIINVWNSEYMLSGLVKAFTALVSILTSLSIIIIFPKLMKEWKLTKKNNQES
jgi:ribulose-5-phosphate 4-epimerase/fuculose-1-phosphate aldolase